MIVTGHNKAVYIFSTDLPKGHVDVFMLSELEELSKRQVDITLFPLIAGSAGDIDIPDKVIVNYCMQSYTQADHKIDLRLLFTFAKVLCIDLLYNKGAFWRTLGSIRQTFSYFKSLYFKASYLNDNVSNFESNAVFYSYWWEEWNLMLIILKLRGDLNDPKIVTRTHGFDLYTERRGGYVPLRGLQLLYTDTIYTISKNGCNYLQKKYPRFKHKILNFYLGSRDRGTVQGAGTKNEFNVISVSDFREVKRVWLIPEILQHIKGVPVKWTHVGGGNGLEAFKERVAGMTFPMGISYEFTGFIRNEAVYDLYKNHEFDLFMNVSSSEGLPVSIMEAISMGVPAVATDVGGTAEIVTGDTGILLDKNFDPADVAQKITSYLLTLKKDASRKQKIREFWKIKFNDKINSGVFVDHLLSN